ncbi:hypothetical protein VCRA2110O318_150030 [Vibrio crassostreae]|nr:hypothetical protein VCRA2117O328_150072 [Vibrio crassostreae]CAK2276250.1 hypothetical protein VCRA2110O318_150030 [Vibrio crassostreae]CAK2412684.1 hypothetical protein VCRA2110O319_140072 [Vibrio crassostreae]CAK2646430.1 hypothetical protein VCRA217O317_150031 [Vibrio crassostreae]
MLEDPEKDLEMDTLYMGEKGIENKFDEDNNQTKSLAMTVKAER